MRKMLVAAHTGCGMSPDNTMASFEEGMDSGADIVEVDVIMARDGTAVLMHDDSPYLHACGYEQLNRPEIRKLLGPAYEVHEIATLERILQVSETRGTTLNLDLKSEDSVEPAVGLVRKYGAQNRTFITGWHSESIPKRFPDIRVMINTPAELNADSFFTDTLCREARDAGYIGLNMNRSACHPMVVDKAHAYGLTVWVYTVNEREQMEAFIRMGVDAITTRKPEMLVRLLEETARIPMGCRIRGGDEGHPVLDRHSFTP